MAIDQTKPDFVDLNLFYNTPDNYEDVLVFDNRAIIESLRNIFYTETGTRFFNRSFGSNLHYLLFENINPETAQVISMSIYNVLKNYEPRIEIYPLGITVVPDYDNNAYDITVSYKNLTNGQYEVAATSVNRNR